MSVDFERNAQIVNALERVAVREHASSGYTVDGYEVRVHPDLVARLRELMTYIPNARFEYVFGTPTLCTAAGDIFATVNGTKYLSLHLPENAYWGTHYEEFGKLWRQGSAWTMGRPHSQEDEERFASLVGIAYSSVL
jgi:hypothetical protein